jgi:hypothetical protein
MKLIYCLILAGLIPRLSSAQPFVYPKFEKTVRSPGDLIPSRWHIRDSVSGDLNKDGRTDMAMVLEYADTVHEMRPDSMEITAHPRILLVLFRDSATGGYRPVCQNNTFIVREGEGGMLDDPYGEISIRNNILTVEIQFLRAAAVYKFRWQKGDLYLIGASDNGIVSPVTGSAEGWEFNFSTSKAKHTWSRSNTAKEHIEWRTFQPRSIRLRDLRQYGSIEIFESVLI